MALGSSKPGNFNPNPDPNPNPNPGPNPSPNDVPSGEPGSEICSTELSASADFAVCGRADGAVLLMRYSRDPNP
eukprot:scaffold61378_cov27-Phaeocystis_antarctica.AAC.1